MPKKLTAKQDKFARLVAEGKTQADAYREAYNASNMKPETIHKRASELFLDGVVAGRIDELKKEFTKKLDIVSTITVERQIKYTQKAIQECLKTGDFNNYLKAMDMQNKLIGLYAPTKTEGKTTLEFTEKEARNNLKNKLDTLDE
jgi:hypothetical protein